MREKMKQRVVQYVVLMAGILALLSVVIPHHHHRDGMPCYQSLTAEQAHGDKSTDTHDCGCDGITWPISVRIFLILWMEMWIYI